MSTRTRTHMDCWSGGEKCLLGDPACPMAPDTAAPQPAQSQAWCVVVEEPSDNRETYECATIVGPFDNREEAVAAADDLRDGLRGQGYTLTATPTQLRTVAEVLR